MLELLTTISGIVISFAWYMQAYKIFKAKSAKDISLVSVTLIWGCSFIWLFYAISINSFPLEITEFTALIGLGATIGGIVKYK